MLIRNFNHTTKSSSKNQSFLFKIDKRFSNIFSMFSDHATFYKEFSFVSKTCMGFLQHIL